MIIYYLPHCSGYADAHIKLYMILVSRIIPLFQFMNEISPVRFRRMCMYVYIWGGVAKNEFTQNYLF